MDSRLRRSSHVGAMLEELSRGLRRLLRIPGFALTVVSTLALAIGVNAVVFSLVHGILLSPLPYPDADRIVTLWMDSPAFAHNTRIRQSPATYLQFANGSRTFEAIALAESRTVTLDDDVRAERLQAAVVTPSIHTLLGIPIALGRTLVESDSLPGAQPVVVISHSLWVEQLGQDPAMTSRTLKIDRVAHQVVGVLPQGSAFPAADTRLWLPITIDPAAPAALSFRYSGYGRLMAGVDEDTARRDLDRLIHALPDAYPEGFSREVIEQAEITARVRSLGEETVGEVRPILRILLATVLAILLIATANLANLFAVRTESRHRNLAIQSALGAGRGFLWTSVVAECFWLAAVSTVLGLGLGVVALEGLQVLAPQDLPRLQEVRQSLPVMAFTVLLSLAAAWVASLLSVWGLRGRSLLSSLRSDSERIGEGPRPMRTRKALVTLQVAIALVLMVASGLLVRSYHSLTQIDPGFASEDVLTLRIALPEAGYEDWSKVVAFFHDLLGQVRSLPGVETATGATSLPLRDGSTLLPYRVESEPLEQDAVKPTAQTLLVGGDYFSTLKVLLIEGRAIERRDAETAAAVAVVNEAFARHHWPKGSAIGRRILLGSAETWLEVVGVVGDVHDRSLVDPPAPILYLPLIGPEPYSFARKELSLAVSSTRAESLGSDIRTVLAGMDRGVPIYDVRTLERVTAAATARSRWTAYLLTSAALGALFLAAIGLSGLMAYMVGRRQREIGIRMALGASHRQVRSMVIFQALTLVALGIVIGTVGALLLGRLLDSLLYEWSPSDPVVLISAVGFLLVIAFLAADFPARRACRLDPAVAVRGED